MKKFTALLLSLVMVLACAVSASAEDTIRIGVFEPSSGDNGAGGKQEVKKALRSVVWVKYKIKDKEVFDKAYSYIEQYY